MRSSLEQFERVSDYVSGRMSESERSLFELEMNNDSYLQEQVDFQKDMIRIVERKALRAEIGAVAAQYAATGGMSLLTKLLLSSVAIATVAILTFFLLNTSEVTPKVQQNTAQVARETVIEEPETSAPAGVESKANVTNSQEPKIKKVSLTDWLLRTDHSNKTYIQGTPLVASQDKQPAFYSIPEDSLMREMVKEYTPEETRVKKSSFTASWSISSLRRSVFKRSTAGQKAALRSTAVVKIADLEGSPINDARMTYTLFGETKTVDVNGTYAFKLYQDIRTNVIVEFGNGEQVILESVEFSPRRTTFLQIETVLSDKLPERRER